MKGVKKENRFGRRGSQKGQQQAKMAPEVVQPLQGGRNKGRDALGRP